MKSLIAAATALAVLAPTSALAGTLGDYKKQKHEKRERVSDESCSEAYKKRCKAECSSGNATCLKRCNDTAQRFCEERDTRQTVKTVEVAAKGASVAAPIAAAAIIYALTDAEDADAAGKEKLPPNPYSIRFFDQSLTLDLGGGLLQAGAKGAAAAPPGAGPSWASTPARSTSGTTASGWSSPRSGRR
ncbi:MAG: hypothetical protein ACOX6T_17325 [Myxococcales bacterium]